ncbi:MAG: MFS transporter [Pseudomonadota bacterium]
MNEHDSAPPQPALRRRKLAIAGIAGNVLEWYDFAVYGYFAPVLAQLFFPSQDPTVSLIAAYGAFAAGFVMRPLGALFFGHIGDRYGRKTALVCSIALMAVSSLAIGILPTYEQIGIAASVLMVVIRLFQGAAVGGEFTTSVVYLAEIAPGNRRGFFASWAMSGSSGGILLGSLAGAVLSYLLSDAQLNDWGWRIPFLFGVMVAVSAYFLRRTMIDVQAPKRLDFPLGHMIRHHWRGVLHVFCLSAGFAVAYYIGFLYVSGWLVSQMHESHAEALTFNSISIATMVVLVPFIARASDRIGRKPVMVTGAALILIIAHPMAWMMTHPDPLYALAGQLAFALGVAIFMAPLPVAFAEMFPANIRVTAVSAGYNLALAVFGGTAPMLATWLDGYTGDRTSFAWYVTGIGVMTLIGALLLKETLKKPFEKG